jgi:hypothetical protein
MNRKGRSRSTSTPEPVIFIKEIGCEDPFVTAGVDLAETPETAVVEFFGLQAERAFVFAAISGDIFRFIIVGVEILVAEGQRNLRDSDLFGQFPQRGFRIRLSGRQVPADGGIPLAGLDILAGRPFLKKQIPPAVENQNMGHPVNQVRPPVNGTAFHSSENPVIPVNQIKKLSHETIMPQSFFLYNTGALNYN